MKAIETEYKGYKFRSRLEARWAIFFDCAGIAFEYEPEGLDMDGLKWLPDFYLPESKTYVEVKPPRNGAFKELAKPLAFVQSGNVQRLLILSNIPDDIVRMLWEYRFVYYNHCYDYAEVGNGVFAFEKDRVVLKTYGRDLFIPLESPNCRITSKRNMEWLEMCLGDDVAILNPKHVICPDNCNPDIFFDKYYDNLEEPYLIFNSISAFEKDKTLRDAFSMARKAQFEYLKG